MHFYSTLEFSINYCYVNWFSKIQFGIFLSLSCSWNCIYWKQFNFLPHFYLLDNIYQRWQQNKQKSHRRKCDCFCKLEIWGNERNCCLLLALTILSNWNLTRWQCLSEIKECWYFLSSPRKTLDEKLCRRSESFDRYHNLI